MDVSGSMKGSNDTPPSIPRILVYTVAVQGVVVYNCRRPFHPRDRILPKDPPVSKPDIGYLHVVYQNGIEIVAQALGTFRFLLLFAGQVGNGYTCLRCCLLDTT